MHSMQLSGKSDAFRLIQAQFVAALLAALLLLPLGWVDIYSGLIGGMIAMLANAYFAARIFARYRAQDPARITGRFYGAELQKLILTGLLFAAAILWVRPLSIGALLGVFLFVQIVPMLVSHFYFEKIG